MKLPYSLISLIAASAVSSSSAFHFSSASRSCQLSLLRIVPGLAFSRSAVTPRRSPPTTTSTRKQIVLKSTVAASSEPLPKGTATVSQEIINLVKAIVGSGVLTLPAGIAAFGTGKTAVVPAVMMITIIGCLSGYAFGLIARVCSLTNTQSYRGAWEASVGEDSSWIPAWSVTLKTFFAILAYSMILGDTFHSLALTVGLKVTKTATLCSITAGVLLPLCLLKNLSSLAPFSVLGTLGMAYTAIAMGIRFFGGAYNPGGQFATHLPAAFRPTFGSVGAAGALTTKASILLGMLSTSYMAHFNSPRMFIELKDRTVPKFMKVVGTSFAVSIIFYCIMASLGFLTFGGASAGLILNNYSTKDTLMGFSRAAVAIAIVGSYPIAFVGARDGVMDLFKIKNKSTSFLNALTVGILSFITAAALSIPDVSFVMAFAGSTLGNAIIYIFPAIMFRSAIKKYVPHPPKLQKFELKATVVSALLGLVFGTMGAVSAVKSIL
jgi:amino acid permease